jgi:hypothetical protein
MGGIDPGLAAWPREEKPRLFENRPDHNPSREPRRRQIFLFESAVTH